MTNLPKIIDNERVSLLEIFTRIASKHDTLSIATGYWDLAGTNLIIEELKKFRKVQLLIGRELLIPRHQIHRPEPDYPDMDFFHDLEQIVPDSKLKQTIIDIKDLIKKGILEVKVYRNAFLHAKCYIFGNYDSAEAVGIIGSSNFTKNGLTKNAELNALESDHRIVTFKPLSKGQEIGHLYWFDQLWNSKNAEVWNGKFSTLLELSPAGDILFSPYETYIKTLYELYLDELADEDLDSSLRGSHELMAFQLKNVHALMRRLKKYKVAMLSDSVGLGKTYTAIEVIKQYLTGEEGLRRVEIICPKSLKEQWSKELATQGVFNLAPVTLQNQTDIDGRRELDHIASVSLFVIDESHNLKNRAGKRFEQIIEWIRNNPKAHVLLVTATPINNQLNDITNQILLGTRGESNILKVTVNDRDSNQTVPIDFHQAIENLKKKINQDLSRTGTIDYEHIREIMAPILRAFVVRRTRQGIKKEYGNLVIDGKEKAFPQANPEVKKYGYKKEIADQLLGIKSTKTGINLKEIYLLPAEEIINNTKDLKHPLDQIGGIETKMDEDALVHLSPVYFVYQIVLLLGFIPYRWRMYQTKFYGKTRDQIKEMRVASEERELLFLQISIYGILRTLFLKRMESSVNAVKVSLETYKRKLAVFEKGLKLGKILSLKDLINIEEKLGLSDEDADPEDVVFDDEEILDSIDEKKYDLQALKNDLEKENQLLNVLEKQLAILEHDDSKLRAFADLLEDLNNQHPGGKVLVFSYYADTIQYLEKPLPGYAPSISKDNAGFLSSRNRSNAEEWAGRFSPTSQKYQLAQGEKPLRYLFSTDILSEGQKLQDCGVLVNYDLHWNPVRMIQRNGRINRIGTNYTAVYIYNICPESQLEEYLKLVERLEGKINLIRHTIGTDTPVLDEKEYPIEFSDSWAEIYSDSLQKRMRAIEAAEKDSDFLLSEDEFVSDLKIFHNDLRIEDSYKQKIYGIPAGKWALMPTDPCRGALRPDILTLATLYEKDAKVAAEIKAGQAFISMTPSGDKVSSVTILQALEWLKAAASDNTRVADKISINKKHFIDLAGSGVGVYYEKAEVGAPIGQQADILRLMYENHFNEETIEKVRLGFQTSNVLDKQKLSRLVRAITRASRTNKPFLDILSQLVDVAVRTLSMQMPARNFASAKQVLFYVRENN